MKKLWPFRSTWGLPRQPDTDDRPGPPRKRVPRQLCRVISQIKSEYLILSVRQREAPSGEDPANRKAASAVWVPDKNQRPLLQALQRYPRPPGQLLCLPAAMTSLDDGLCCLLLPRKEKWTLTSGTAIHTRISLGDVSQVPHGLLAGVFTEGDPRPEWRKVAPSIATHAY